MKELEIESRAISELQSSATEIVEQARQQGEVAITRYGRTVAWLESPEQHDWHRQLDEAAERASVRRAIERGLDDFRNGRVTDWDDFMKEVDEIIRVAAMPSRSATKQKSSSTTSSRSSQRKAHRAQRT